MALITTYQDLFPLSTTMLQHPGNGTITIPSSGDARLVCGVGATCDWFNATPIRAPFLYKKIRDLFPTGQPLVVETKLSYYTGTATNRIAGLCITTEPDAGSIAYSYQFGYYKGYNQVVGFYYGPGIAQNILTFTNAADPVSTPHLYRFYWNPWTYPLVIEELNLVLPSGYFCVAFSVNNGTTWTSIGTRATDFDLMQAYAGIFSRTQSAFATQADFAYFTAKQWPADFWKQVPESMGRMVVTAALEDAGATLGQSGQPRFDALGVNDPVQSDAMLPLEDLATFPAVAGPRPRYEFPQIQEDLSVRDSAALEDSLFVQVDETDYIKNKYDADGKELIGGFNTRHVFYYDATLDPWHTHGAGFYGAGRDGVLYYDGVACGPGTFGTLAGGINRAGWAAKDGYLDFGWAATPTISADDEMTCTVTPSINALGLTTNLRWFLTGNFDIQIDYQIVSTGAGPTDNGIVLMATMDWNNEFYVRRKMWNSNLYDKDVKNNGSWASYSSVATSDTSGKLRLVRAGSVVSAYYWNGSAWVQIGSNYTMTYARPVFLQAYLQQSGGTAITATVKIRNFTINSGTTSNLIGWAREASGTYRGVRSDFPEHALIISTESNIDIIDADTSKLWMSFRGATNCIVGGAAGSYYVRQVVMKDGVLMFGMPSVETAADGGFGGWVDFNIDCMRILQPTAGAYKGGYYNVELTTGVVPRDSANGCIAFRNSTRGFFGNYANWVIQTYRVHWTELLHDSGYQYRVFATGAGITMQRWQRWKFEGVAAADINTPNYGISTEVGVMRWVKFQASTLDLFYHDRSKLFIVHYATWAAIIIGGGGSWVENHAYDLSGTLELGERALAQDSMVVVGNYLYYARKEGVYRMDLTTGVSVLRYGVSGSGATYEILPFSRAAISVAYAVDGSTPILFVGMTYPDLSVGVNMDTNTIYWKGRLDDSHVPLTMAVGA